MGTVLPRSDITEWVIATISEKITVGDGKAPEDGGWDNDPNHPDSSYSPYVVIVPMPVSESSGPIGDSRADYRVPFSLAYYGISRSQVDQYSDMCRKHLDDQKKPQIVSWAGEAWKVQKIEPSSIGGVTRSDAVEPSIYNQFDVITLWLSRDINGDPP